MAAADNESFVPAAAAADMPLFGDPGNTSGSHPHSISSAGCVGDSKGDWVEQVWVW